MTFDTGTGVADTPEEVDKIGAAHFWAAARVAGVITLVFRPRDFLAVVAEVEASADSDAALFSEAAAAATISSITDILVDNSIIFFLERLGKEADIGENKVKRV